MTPYEAELKAQADALVAPYEDELIARYYRPWTFRMFRWGLKLGPLTVYAYRCGVGWTWRCGYGHEWRWARL